MRPGQVLYHRAEPMLPGAREYRGPSEGLSFVLTQYTDDSGRSSSLSGHEHTSLTGPDTPLYLSEVPRSEFKDGKVMHCPW